MSRSIRGTDGEWTLRSPVSVDVPLANLLRPPWRDTVRVVPRVTSETKRVLPDVESRSVRVVDPVCPGDSWTDTRLRAGRWESRQDRYGRTSELLRGVTGVPPSTETGVLLGSSCRHRGGHRGPSVTCVPPFGVPWSSSPRGPSLGSRRPYPLSPPVSSDPVPCRSVPVSLVLGPLCPAPPSTVPVSLVLGPPCPTPPSTVPVSLRPRSSLPRPTFHGPTPRPVSTCRVPSSRGERWPSGPTGSGPHGEGGPSRGPVGSTTVRPRTGGEVPSRPGRHPTSRRCRGVGRSVPTTLVTSVRARACDGDGTGPGV